MAKLLFLLLLAAGAILMIFGSTVSSSVASSFSRLFSSGAMDRSVWLFLGGGVLFGIGLTGLVLGTRNFVRDE